MSVPAWKRSRSAVLTQRQCGFRIVKRQASAYSAIIALRLLAFPGFGIVFATTCFAQLTHHSIPGLVQPIRLKKRLPKLFAQSMGITFIFYALLGALPSVYFGIYVGARVSGGRK